MVLELEMSGMEIMAWLSAYWLRAEWDGLSSWVSKFFIPLESHSHAVTEIEVWTVSVCLQYLHPVYLIIVFIFLFSVGMRADILNDMTVALSNDTLAVRDKANEKGESTTPNFP